jgi:hypothetical protein
MRRNPGAGGGFGCRFVSGRYRIDAWISRFPDQQNSQDKLIQAGML